jgi:hypothetical protein
MSSLHDPFDLLKTGQEMDNVVPFLAPNKINQMIDNALTQPQFQAHKTNSSSLLKFGGIGGAAMAACLAVFMVFLTSPNSSLPVDPVAERSVVLHPVAPEIANEDVSEFSELVMLETWERE